jgi:hypothetical protein
VIVTALSVLAPIALIAIAFWMLGGIVLRVGGLVLFSAALFAVAIGGSPALLIVGAIGGLAWLTGHWLFALRHHYYSSPLARRIFLQALPRRLDPTRGWGIPTQPPEQR